MIGVRKIVYACYEMPDPQQQAEYYTDILGLTLVEKDSNAIYLANTVEHHAVVWRKGAEAKCVRLGFEIGPEDDLAAFERQTAAHGIKTETKKDAEPTIGEIVSFEDPKGTVMEVFKRPEPLHHKFQRKGIVPHK